MTVQGCTKRAGKKAIYIEKVMEYIRRTVADMQMLMEKAPDLHGTGRTVYVWRNAGSGSESSEKAFCGKEL